MSVIWKYPVFPEFTLPLPHGAEILAVDLQAGIPCMWVLVNETAPKVPRHFRVHKTGASFNGINHEHVGTWQMKDENEAPLVFHLFEVTPP